MKYLGESSLVGPLFVINKGIVAILAAHGKPVDGDET
jgi:hypothetical protein